MSRRRKGETMTEIEVPSDELCTAIEPIYKDVMCQRTDGHSGLHFAEGLNGNGGRWSCEWMEPSRIMGALRRAQEANQ